MEDPLRDFRINAEGSFNVAKAAHDIDVSVIYTSSSKVYGNKLRPVPQQAYNVGGGCMNTISLLELCDPWRICPSFDEWRPADQKVFFCNIEKAEKSFGWSPSVSLAEGLEDLCRWTADSLK